jgi:hypothetical protein
MSKGAKVRAIATLVGLFCLLAIPSPASAMKFQAPDNALSGLNYVARTVSADFNGDGRDDLAVGTASPSNPGIRIRLAQSDGTWSTAATVDSGYVDYSVASGDFNNDNKADLVVLRSGAVSPRVAAFLGNGDGTFGSAITISNPWDSNNSLGSWHALTTGDLNNDGNDDIVFPLGHGDFAVSFSNGSGGFSTANATYVTGAPSGVSDYFVTASIGDYNGDGHQDIALGMAPSTLNDPSLVDVFVMLGDGAGNFSPAAGNPVPVTETAGYVGSVYSLASGHFNNDGPEDLAISTAPDGRGLNTPDTGTIQVMLGSSTNGLDPATVVAYSPDRPGPVLTGDFDRDGITDLAWMERVTPNGPSVDHLVIQRGNGNGTFSADPNSPFTFADGTGSTTDMVSGDFNGDGARDFAAGYGNEGAIRFLMNVPDLSAAPAGIDFGNIVKSSTQASRLLQVRNSGGPNTQVGTVTLTGDDAADFTLPSDCDGWTLNAANPCYQHVKFTPNLDPGSYSANIHVAFTGSSETLDIPVNAKIVVPRVSFDPTALDFGQLRSGQSKTLTVVATNTGDAALTFMPDAPINDNAGGYFTKTSDSCSGSSVGPGDTCSVEIKATGDNASIDELETAELHLASDAYQGQTDVNLSFTGINPGITVDPTNGQFGSVTLGNSSEKTFTISSSGTTDLDISDVEISGNQDTDFRLADGSTDCEGTYAPDDGCEVTVEFHPESTDPAQRTGQITIQTNAQDSAIVVPLTGTAVKGDASFSPDEIDFGDVTLGQSATKTVTVTSNGTAPVEADDVWVDGPNGARDVSVASENCSGHPIAVGQTCTIQLKFTPTERGEFDDVYAGLEAPAISDEVHMVGNGVQPAAEFDATGFEFGSTAIGAAGDRPKHAFTLTSTGLDPVTVHSLAIDGPDASSFKLADAGVCSAALPTDEKCQITVTFDPKDGNAGSRSATLTADTTGGVVEAALSGTATTPLTYKAKIQVKKPKKIKVGKKTKFKVKITNTGTGALSGLVLKYKATQGKSGKAKVSKTAKLPTFQRGYSTSKTVAVTLPKKKFKRGKTATLTFSLVRQGTTLAIRKMTVKLDFGQAKSRRPRDVSNT